MILWIDAQLSPHLAPWVTERFGVEASSARRLGLRDATDREIFFAARRAKAVVLTKDQDFVRLLERHGSPPQILWLTAGSTSNLRLRVLFDSVFELALVLLRKGEALVEIGDGAGHR